MRAPISLCLPILALAACSSSPRLAAPTAPARIAAPAPVALPMPTPPLGAAPNLSLPERLADGSYATPNRDLSEAAAVWHVRSALNVAVLTCAQEPQLAAQYNRMLGAHRSALAKAHAGVSAEYRGAAFDTAMTRVYNYFAQPPVQRAFCPVAADVLAQAETVPAGDFGHFAETALAQLDAPFVDFYRAYDAYRTDLAAWRSGAPTAAAPRLAYDGRDFLTDDSVTGGPAARLIASR
ncbi:MAG: hypothetical protein EOP59_00705 [Sphingomonadales bacterium]|nr:MAG: hypothetical protein EOP59_00705 [Sphingomonadales bacterium]